MEEVLFVFYKLQLYIGNLNTISIDNKWSNSIQEGSQ